MPSLDDVETFRDRQRQYADDIAAGYEKMFGRRWTRNHDKKIRLIWERVGVAATEGART